MLGSGDTGDLSVPGPNLTIPAVSSVCPFLSHRFPTLLKCHLLWKPSQNHLAGLPSPQLSPF